MELSVEFLASVLRTDAEQIAKATKDGEDFKSESEMSAALQKLVEDKVNQSRREARDEGYGRGKKESLTAKEQELRKKFDLKGSTFDEMFSEMVERAKQKPDLTPEDVRNTEIYKLEVQKRDDRIKELSEQSDKVVKTYKAKEVTNTVRRELKALITDKGYAVPEGMKDDDIIFNAIHQSLTNDKTFIEIDDKGNLVVLDETGQIKLDGDTVQPIKFDEYAVSKLDRVYVIPASDGRGSPGNKNGAKGAKIDNPEGFTMPENDEEYMATLATLPVNQKSKYVEFHDAKLAK